MSQPEIETTSSRIAYQNRWMRVREDRIVRADGAAGLYGVVEKPDFVVVAAIEAGQIHLVEQYRYPVGGRYWEMPQGAREGAQIDPLTLAHAELAEETGLRATAMRHAGRLFLAYGLSSQAYDVFLATGLTPGPRALDPEEVGLITRPFALAEFEGMLRDGLIRDASTVAAYGLLRLKGLL